MKMNEQEFHKWLFSNLGIGELSEAYDRGYEAFNDGNEEVVNPYEKHSRDWWLFEEGLGQAAQDW